MKNPYENLRNNMKNEDERPNMKSPDEINMEKPEERPK